MQPDARHYIVTSTTSYQVPRVGQLASVLQQRNISEGTKIALKMHAAAYPEEANEIKKILQKLKIK
jgi:predicted nucleotidyltransferase